MKTAVTTLQEMMMKLGKIPEYECIAQTGPQHQATFEYRCCACGVTVRAAARSKKEAKQEVARLMLQQLSRLGHAVAAPYALPVSAGGASEPAPAPAGGARSYVALLKELCTEYRLAGVEYELVGDTGPPHLRHFTVRARIGRHERVATSTTKKMARQLAAEQLYSYLRENLARVVGDFNEEEALVRAHEKAMERYSSPREEPPRRPDLGQVVAEYHLGLTARMDGAARALALDALERACTRALSPQRALGEMADALGLHVQPVSPPCEEGATLCVLRLQGAAPELAFVGADAAEAAAAAMSYVSRALRTRLLPEPDHVTVAS